MIPAYNIPDFLSAHVIDDQFMLERFENLQPPPKFQWPHKNNFYEIIWVTSGKSINTIDYQQTSIEPDMLFFIFPGQLHLMSEADAVKGYSIRFTEQFLLLNNSNKNAIREYCFLDNCYRDSFFKLDANGLKELQPLLKLMLEEMNRPEKSSFIVSNLLYAFLNRTQRLIVENDKSNFDPNNLIRYKQLKRLIEENFAKESQTGFYADKLNLTAHRVNEICREITGKAFGELIKDRILLETKRLLLHSSQSIGQISESLGFSDFSYFSRQFKKQAGLTPAEFRKEMFGKYEAA